MAFFGNELYLQMQNQGSGSGTFGKGHGASGFGQGGLQSSGFGQQWSSGGLGQSTFSNSAQPISIQGRHMYAQVGPPGLHRRSSLLNDMTQSKSGMKPVYITSCSLISNRSSHDDDVTVISNIFDKPMEKIKKPPLLRQSSVSSDSSMTRPPAFSALASRMRSNTVGAGTMRSISMTEERTQLMNSDLAMPQMKRRHSFHAHSNRRRYSLFGKSSKSRVTPPLTPKSDRSGDQKRRSLTNSELEQETLILSLMNPATQYPGERYTKEEFLRQRHLRDGKLSRQSTRSNSVSSYSSQVSERVDGKSLESPTLVSKKFQHLYPKIVYDEHSIHSGNSSPRSVRSTKSNRSLYSNSSIPEKSCRTPNTKTTPVKYKPWVNNRTNYVNQSDSENSDAYYDCVNPDLKKANKRNTTNSQSRTKRNMNKQARPQRDSTSTCSITDAESTSSIGDSPRATYTKRGKKYNHNNGNTRNQKDGTIDTDDEDEALCVKTIVDQFSKQHGLPNGSPQYSDKLIRQKLETMPNRKPQTNQLYPDIDKSGYANLHAEKTNPFPSTGTTFATKIPDLIVPTYVNIAKAEPSLKDNNHGHDTCADSSESGYTSNKQHSPREYEIKAAQFVNSLPHPRETMKHASETEELSVHSNMSSIGCESGSEPDDLDSQNPASCNSISKAEDNKMLASPTLVKEMFDKSMAKRTGRRKTQDKAISLQNWQRDSINSENENLHLLGATNDTPTVKTPDSRSMHDTQVNTIVSADDSGNTETKLASQQSIGSFSNRSFGRRMLSFGGLQKPHFPSIAQTDRTNRLDMLLHVLNVLIFLSSIGIIVTAIWLLLKDFNPTQITEIFGNNILQIIAYVAVAGAGIAMLASLCLCCGIRRDKFGLGCYAFVLIIVVIAFSLASILSVIFADRLNGIELKFNFQDRLITRYGYTSRSQTDNKMFTESWDSMQMQFGCCGAHGTVNDTTSWAVYRKFSTWFRKQPLKATVFVPESCCVKNKNVAVCQGSDHELLGPPVYGPPMDKQYDAVNPNINTNGCYDIVAPYLTSMVTYIAVVIGILAVLYFLVAFLTWMFCLKKKHEFDDPYFSGTDYGDYEEDETDNVFAETNNDETDHESHSEFGSRETELNRLMSNDSRSRTISEESHEDSLELDYVVSENEIMDRRDRWYRSDVQMNNLFTLTIEEEDSDFEDNASDDKNTGGDDDETVVKKPMNTSF